MIRQFELVERVRDYNPHANEALLNRAYVYGAKAHAHQKRASGDPYFGHPLEVAWILTDLKLDDATIVTALLHDTIEDTEATFDEIRRLFGDEIAELVDGVTKLSKIELSSQEAAQAENFRKLLLAMARDVRVILVKLADRLHNMRTLEHLRPDKRQRIARETMEIYAPLAGRMGMQSMREELEDKAFEVLNAEGRISIMRRFLKLRQTTGDLIPRISAEITAVLDAAGIRATVHCREKRPYSIWRKMQEKQIGFSQLSDIYGFRILCDDEADCYRALGVIHRTWRAVPARFKDYISGPKQNGYRSIHTTVQGRAGRQPRASGDTAPRIEMQIRTHQMHSVAETGVAAHWAYKDGAREANPFAVDPYVWLRDLTQRMDAEPQEFLEHVKLDMFTDQVFCFTPKGDVIGLPRGATPIDFAYFIHTRVGDHCVGALIDGHRRPLWTRLRNGQQVEIITSDAQSPSPRWEDMATTGRAKSAIRKALRDRLRADRIALGRDLAAQAFSRSGHEAGDKTLASAARRLGLPVEEMLVALATGEMPASRIVNAVFPDPGRPPEKLEAEPQPPAIRVQGQGVRRGRAVSFCTCCFPVPGERIVGLKRQGVMQVHAITCPLLAQWEDEADRWIDLTWHAESAAHPDNLVRIRLVLANQPGMLGQVCTLIGARHANIDNLAITTRKPDFFRMQIDLEVRDVKHLSEILTALAAQDFVSEAERVVSLPEEAAAALPGEGQPQLPLGRAGPARV